MINFFDKLYSSVNDKNKFLSRMRIYSLFRFLIRLTANIILPIYFYLTQYSENNKLKHTVRNNNNNLIIVSLTSFPARISRLWLTIETIMRQTQKPDKIIVWLSKQQFSDINFLPNSLLRLQKRGLEIRLCNEDLQSHKKYYYAIKEFPNDIIITVDDDVFYNTKLIDNLISLNKKFPKCVCCNYCTEIKILDNQIQPYLTWDNYYISKIPDFKIFPIGKGGILYPPKILNSNVLNSDIFTEKCIFADDIWLNIMTKMANNMVVKSNYNSQFLPVMNYKDITLTEINVNEGLNDKQLIDVRNYCINYLGKDPFEKILIS